HAPSSLFPSTHTGTELHRSRPRRLARLSLVDAGDLLVPDAEAAAEEATTFRARPPRRGRRRRGLHGRCRPVLLSSSSASSHTQSGTKPLAEQSSIQFQPELELGQSVRSKQRTMGTPTATVAALALLLLLCVSMSSLSGCLAAQYKVGGLDAWGIPPSTKPDVYVRWAKSVPVKLGDALFFLYPPSQDSAVQVTAKAFAACDVSDPLLKPSADDSSGSAES
uniref:Phytocyanin domain-containing protein n=1 Tax=Aegilops tauschii subsp. strangulata TaxID=200361 RepID=A0A453I0S6_AEGTS